MGEDGMAKKDDYITFRTSPEIKKVLQRLADEGYRTLSQQAEMAVTEWLKDQGHLKKIGETPSKGRRS